MIVGVFRCSLIVSCFRRRLVPAIRHVGFLRVRQQVFQTHHLGEIFLVLPDGVSGSSQKQHNNDGSNKARTGAFLRGLGRARFRPRRFVVVGCGGFGCFGLCRRGFGIWRCRRRHRLRLSGFDWFRRNVRRGAG